MLGFFVIAVVFTATIFIIGGWLERRRVNQCSKYRYVYRPTVRTFTEEQAQPPSVFKTYKNMFWKRSPWVTTTAHPSEFDRGLVNPMVWGGLPKTELGTVKEDSGWQNDAF